MEGTAEIKGMTKTEKLAYNWFLSQGYKPAEISFDPRRHIDFIVAGKPYEVKRLYQKNIIYTTKSQYEKLKDPNVTILVFDEGCSKPVFVGSLKEIEDRFKVFIVDLMSKTFKVRLPKEVVDRLDELIEKGVISGYAEAVRRGLELFLEQYRSKRRGSSLM